MFFSPIQKRRSFHAWCVSLGRVYPDVNYMIVEEVFNRENTFFANEFDELNRNIFESKLILTVIDSFD